MLLMRWLSDISRGTIDALKNRRQIGFSDHYAFHPQTLTFSLLPSENVPSKIYSYALLYL